MSSPQGVPRPVCVNKLFSSWVIMVGTRFYVSNLVILIPILRRFQPCEIGVRTLTDVLPRYYNRPDGCGTCSAELRDDFKMVNDPYVSIAICSIRIEKGEWCATSIFAVRISNFVVRVSSRCEGSGTYAHRLGGCHSVQYADLGC